MKILKLAAVTLGSLLCVACTDDSNPSNNPSSDNANSNVVYSYVRAFNKSWQLDDGYQLDTITLTSQRLKCDIDGSDFKCVRSYYCGDYSVDVVESLSGQDSLEPLFDYDNADTVYLNYGDGRISDFSFEAKVPGIDSVGLRKAFAEFRSSVCTVLKDSIFTNYSLKAKGLPENISFAAGSKIDGFSWELKSSATKDSVKVISVDLARKCPAEPFLPDSVTSVAYCRLCEVDPQPLIQYIMKNDPIKTCVAGTVVSTDTLKKDVLRERAYTLVSTRTEPFASDTTINWTLIYVDQYGRKDSLAMTTKFLK